MNWHFLSIAVLLTIVAAKSLFNILVAFSNIRWLETKRKKERHERMLCHDRKLFLLLPVFFEQKLIVQTIKYYYPLIKDLDNVFLIVITSEKEENKLKRKQQATRNLASESIN